MANKVSRLNFLKTAGLAASGAMLTRSASANTVRPEIIPDRTASPARKVNLALIGIAYQGGSGCQAIHQLGTGQYSCGM